jgi:hypothetical protein
MIATVIMLTVRRPPIVPTCARPPPEAVRKVVTAVLVGVVR